MTRIYDLASTSSAIGKDMYEVHPVFSGLASLLSSISPLIEPVLLSKALEERGTIGIFASAIRYMNYHSEKYLFNLSPESSGELTRGELDLDSFFASATHAEAPKGISADKLSKVWKIYLDSTKRTLDVTTQRRKRSNDPTLSRSYSTND